LGTNGLNAGVAAAPGFSYTNIGILYRADRLKNPDGDPIPVSGSFDLNTDQNSFVYMTKYKLLGGTIGASFDLILANQSISGPQIGINTAGMGIGDSYVQPLVLGYHYSRIDFTVGLGLMVPTGRFERVIGSPNSIGSGYWGYMPSVGATAYLTKNKHTTLSGFGLYEFHGTKRYTEIRPGQTFNFEGGLGQVIPVGKNSFQLGAVGYGQWQTTATNGPVPIVIRDARYRVGSIGPQASFNVPKWNLNFFFRYLPEFGAVSRVEGTTYAFGGTISFPVVK
jgi:hypothetical protein